MAIEHTGAHVGGAWMGRRGVLLTRGSAPQDGMTPLFVAARNGHDKVVHFLLREGVDVTAKTKVSERRVGGERREVGVKSFGGRVLDSHVGILTHVLGRLLSGADR